MRVVTLSGWGQPHDALAAIAPEAYHIDYAKHDNVQNALAEIAEHKSDIVIGWSLGGQLAVRAMAARAFTPSKLVLIATPFQFVTMPDKPLGMGRDTYRKFRNNYAKTPERTLNKAWELIYHGDKNADRVRAHLEKNDKKLALEKNWLFWLDALDGYSLHGEDLNYLPPTLLLHGDKDAVVAMEQSDLFARAIPQAKTVIFAGAGHAPHWHDTELVRRHIRDFANV